MHQRDFRILWTILTLSLALRTVWALIVPVAPLSDSKAYDIFAVSILEGRGYAFEDGSLTAFWPVGTSGLYALLYFVFGKTWHPIVVTNIFLGVLLTYLTFILGRNWFSVKIGLIAATVVAAWPMLIQFTTILASELPFTTLLCFTMVVFFSKRQIRINYGLAGVILGIACFFRPTAIIMLLLLPLLEFISSANKSIKQLGFQFLLLCLGFALVVGPWAWRNTKLFDSTVLISTNFGPNLWMGNNPASKGEYMSLPEDRTFTNEAVRDRALRAEAIDNIISDPVYYLGYLSWKRFLATHDRETIGIVWNDLGLREAGLERGIRALKAVSTLYWWSLGLLAILGIAVLKIRSRRFFIHPIFVVPLVFVLIPTLTVGQDRYHFALVPFVAILSSLTIERIFANRKDLR